MEEEEEDEEMQKKHQRDAKFDLVVSLAEKYYDRFDVNAFLELLPRKTPVSVLLKYFQIVYEYQGSRKRNLQVSCLVIALDQWLIVTEFLIVLDCASTSPYSRGIFAYGSIHI